MFGRYIFLRNVFICFLVCFFFRILLLQLFCFCCVFSFAYTSAVFSHCAVFFKLCFCAFHFVCSSLLLLFFCFGNCFAFCFCLLFWLLFPLLCMSRLSLRLTASLLCYFSCFSVRVLPFLASYCFFCFSAAGLVSLFFQLYSSSLWYYHYHYHHHHHY